MHTTLQPIVKVTLSTTTCEDLRLDDTAGRAYGTRQASMVYRELAQVLTELLRGLKRLLWRLSGDTFGCRNAVL